MGGCRRIFVGDFIIVCCMKGEILVLVKGIGDVFYIMFVVF